MNLYVGCPIWAYKGWVGSFYPEGTKPGDFLWEYARRLATVEGNTTFYAVPAAKILQQWAAETPDTFRFCPKLPRTISHAGKLVEHIEEAMRFVEVMSQLGDRLGPMFLQLPPRYPPALFDDLQAFLQAWPAEVPLAVEVRHMGWFGSPHNETLNELLSRYRMARVVIDTRPIRSLQGEKILEGSVYQRLLEARQRKPNVPILPERTAPFVFLRYIGHPQFETNAPFLDEWVDYLTAWLGEGDTEAYVFCHCPDERLDPWLCRHLYRRVAERLPLPPLPWDETGAHGGASPKQERLF
jgi:uncharacterized protein YecE (DUF72 family)